MQKRCRAASAHVGLIALAMLALASCRATADSTVLSAWKAVYPSSTLGTTYSCQLCHTRAPNFNPYGQAISDEWSKTGFAGSPAPAIEAVEPLDSDVDGYSNIAEITANTLPGDATSHPTTDITPPSAPTGLTATAASSSQINLSWTASTDNVAVTGYLVYRGPTLVGSPTATSYSDTGLPPSTNCSYTVKAKDAAGNLSAASNTASATTFAPPPTSGTLTGQATEKGTTTALSGAVVNAYQSGVLKASTTTGANGVYTISQGLATGTYVVVASKVGYVAQTKTSIGVTVGATTYVNFFLGRVCLMGQVKAAGTTTVLAGATVAAYQGSVLAASATTDANGIYQISGLTTGTYTVIASKTAYVKQTKPGISFTAGTITYVNFNLQVSGKLMGQVTNKVTGAPIIGATVSARTGGVVQATGITVGPYGVYQITSDLPAGTYTMLCTATGYQNFGRIGIVVTAGATTYANFPLQPQ